MGLECRQETITLQGKAGDEVGSGLGYGEVKRWEEKAEYRKLGVLARAVGTGRGTFPRSVNAPRLPAFPSSTSLSLGPLSFHPNTGPQGAPSLGSHSRSRFHPWGTPTAMEGGGYEATHTTDLRRSRDPEVANIPQSTWQKRKRLGRLKESSQVLYEHDYQILADSVAGHARKHQQKY